MLIPIVGKQQKQTPQHYAKKSESYKSLESHRIKKTQQSKIQHPMKEVVNNHPHHSTKKAIKRGKQNQAKEWTTKETGI